jgi:hypothetical protein
MKISFWSHVRGKTGVTTNLACVSALMSIGGVGKTTVLENHYSANSIGDMILVPEKLHYLREHGEYYSRYGIEYILKRLYSGESGEKLFHHASIPLLFSSMYYLPQGQIVNKEVFNYEFNLVQKELFEALERMSDYVFVDTEANQNLSSTVILSEADLIVVNFSQNPDLIQEYFNQYTSMTEKAVYLIGNYQADSVWNISRICREFHIPRQKIGIIPYNMELAEAMAAGHLLQFLNRNYYKASDYDNDYLIRYIKKAGQMIRKNLIRIRREELAEGTEIRSISCAPY